MFFNELGLPDYIIDAVNDMGFKEPTEIQYKAIPHILNGKDVIGKSRTGTGKTAAFSIPAIMNVSNENKNNVTTLVLCPTRELAMQVCEQMKNYSKYKKNAKVLPIYGGQSYDRQISGLKRGANIVVGTPGRVIDHIKRRTLSLENVEKVILDEADEMLNMGFKEDIETILEKSNKDRQTILFSATMPRAILNITKQYQNDPVIVEIENKDNTHSLIKQYYCSVRQDKKVDALYVLLKYLNPKLSIVFCNTKRMVDELEVSLNKLGYNASGIHGDMKQNVRTSVMTKFKTGKTDVLIATDVAARGIDVSGVDVVFNYDVPQDIEYYVHRIGRTGRAGKEGQSFTIVNGNSQLRELLKIKNATKSTMEYFKIPTPSMVKEKSNDDFSNTLLDIIRNNDDDTDIVDSIYNSLKNNGLLDDEISKALIKYSLPKTTNSIPFVENLNDMQISSVGSRTGRKNRENYKSIEISSGRKMGISPNHILGAITERVGISGSCIGKIKILQDVSIVEVLDEHLKSIIKKMNRSRINGKHITVTEVSGGNMSHHRRSRDRFKGYNKSKKR